MHLGELLIARGLVSLDDIDEALRLQTVKRGSLGEHLIALGHLTSEQLSAAVTNVPVAPATVAETGIAPRNLLNLLLKLMYAEPLGTVRELAHRMKLSARIIQAIIDDAAQLRLVQSLGLAAGEGAFSVRYALTEQGKSAARDALEQNLYLGPAPVSLDAYKAQIQQQRITNETVDEDGLRESLSDLVVSDHYIEKLLPAINAGQTMLLFGPPGNGKSTLTSRIAQLFRDLVYIPYAVDVGGQIITLYDPKLHKPAIADAEGSSLQDTPLLDRDRFDERWVACKRPVAVTGGELTLDMLELQHNPATKFYDAPLHVKAMNGMLLIDDFGRQNFHPHHLLNRWIVPMEHQVDYLRLSGGTTFSLPFDGLVIFSTNLEPSELMDPAFLRRIPYKIRLSGPDRNDYRKIFDAAAGMFGFELSNAMFNLVVGEVEDRFGLAYYQPKFICQQVKRACLSFNRPVELTAAGIRAALANLYYDIESERGSNTLAALRPAGPARLESYRRELSEGQPTASALR